MDYFDVNDVKSAALYGLSESVVALLRSCRWKRSRAVISSCKNLAAERICVSEIFPRFTIHVLFKRCLGKKQTLTVTSKVQEAGNLYNLQIEKIKFQKCWKMLKVWETAATSGTSIQLETCCLVGSWASSEEFTMRFLLWKAELSHVFPLAAVVVVNRSKTTPGLFVGV